MLFILGIAGKKEKNGNGKKPGNPKPPNGPNAWVVDAGAPFGGVVALGAGTVCGTGATFGAVAMGAFAVVFGAGTLIAAKTNGRNTTNTGNNISESKLKIKINHLINV